QRRLPRTGSEQRDRLALTRAGDVWTLEIAPTDHVYRARVGQPIVYQGRTARARQDWLRFPVTGITWGDGVAYAAWLDATGRVPGARMCREDEWERAARGADDRLFPSGDRLAADGANIDLTYGRVGSAFGPDEVGSYPDSRSPFGIEDAAGNVMEMVQSILAEDEMVIRGGAYSYAATMAQTPNRTHIIDTGYRSIHAGLRICADLPSVQSGQTP
ncbi:MAG: SUMF1/EgtB/PvdO family nonheme iron enzyme, partial [Myxococcota bacterium]